MKIARAILAWELGAGMGHTSRLRPIADRMLASGIEVVCWAIREQDAARQLPCPVESAPWLKPPERASTPWVGNLSDTLAVLGWNDPEHLRQAVGRWRAVLEAQMPDLLVMDSAPTALLASLGLPIKRVWLANHWSTPPRIRPMPDLQAQITGKVRPVPDTEPAVVRAINACLTEQRQAKIKHIYELFDRAEFSPMLSIPEIDPHGPRPETEYLGVWGNQPGPAPPWPPCSYGPDTAGVFAYLKPFPQRAALLKLLAETRLPILAYTPGLTDHESEAARGGAVHLFSQPIDWLAIAQDTAFIICHGSAGMTGQALQLGLPVLALPTSLEQAAVARQAAKSGAVVVADLTDVQSLGNGLHAMLTATSIITAADKLANQYAGYDPNAAANQLADKIIGLISPEREALL